MAIEFRCQQCQQLLRVPDDSAGKNARCPKCQSLMTVPGPGAAEGAPPPPLPLGPPGGGAPPTPGDQRPAWEAPQPPPPKPSNPFGETAGGSPFAPSASPSLNPYASPAGAAYAYDPNYSYGGQRPGLPWEIKGAGLGTWWETTKLCMMQPSYAFSVMRQYGGLGSPMLYAGYGLAIGTVGQMLWYVPMMVGMMALAGGGQANGNDAAAAIGIQLASQLFGGVLGVVLGATLGLLIAAAIGHVCLMVVGGARQGYETTFRAIGFVQGSTAWLNVIPVVGGLIAFVWLIVIEIIAFSKAHEIDTGKAALAVFLPLLVFCVCGLVIAAIVAGTVGFSAMARP